MCDETIVQLAINPNWREQVVDPTSQRLRPQLTKAQKNQRCRECVIYNTHQEQKYKALVVLVVAALIAFLALFNEYMITIVSTVFGVADAVVNRFSLSSLSNGAQPVVPQVPVYLDWMVMLILLVLALSQILQFVEYCCFKIKI